MKKAKEKGVLCEDQETLRRYVFESLTEASKAFGASPQSVSNSIKRGGIVKKRYRFEITRRYYVVKTKAGAFVVCVFSDAQRKFVEVGPGATAIGWRNVASFRDVTVCMLNEEFIGGFGWVSAPAWRHEKKEKEWYETLMEDREDE